MDNNKLAKSLNQVYPQLLSLKASPRWQEIFVAQSFSNFA